MLRNILLFLSLVFSSALFAAPWPKSTCSDGEHWIEFSELKLCIDKKIINKINILNSDTPSLSLSIDTNEIIFLNQNGKSVTGGLHNRYNVSLFDYFKMLSNRDDSVIDLKVVDKIHEIEKRSDITVYQFNKWHAYVLINDFRTFDEIFIVEPNSDTAYSIGGEFTLAEANRLLSKIVLPKHKI